MIVNGSCTDKFTLFSNFTHALASYTKRFNINSKKYEDHYFGKTFIDRNKLDILTAVDEHFLVSAKLTFEVHDDSRNESYPKGYLFYLSGFALEDKKWITMEMFANNTGTVVGSTDGITVWCNKTRSDAEGSCGQNGLPPINSSVSVAITYLFFHHTNTRTFSIKTIVATGVMFPCQSVGKYSTIIVQ